MKIQKRVIKEVVKKVLIEQKSRLDINSVREAVDFIEDQANAMTKTGNEDYMDHGREIMIGVNKAFESEFDPEAVLDLAKRVEKAMKKLSGNVLSMYPAYAFIDDKLEKGKDDEGK